MSKLFFATAISLAALPTGAAAQSIQSDIHIGYSDLDLSSPAGSIELDRRIARAVSTICENRPHTDIFWQDAVNRCRTKLIRRVEPQRQQAMAVAARSPFMASAK